MSKFNKIYEFEYHLFGQVRKSSQFITDLCPLSLEFYLVSFCPCAAPECDCYNDISVRPPAGTGVQSTLPEMVSKNTVFNFVCLFYTLYEVILNVHFLPIGTVAILLCYLTLR